MAVECGQVTGAAAGTDGVVRLAGTGTSQINAGDVGVISGIVPSGATVFRNSGRGNSNAARSLGVKSF
jgi:hypothetical protein